MADVQPEVGIALMTAAIADARPSEELQPWALRSFERAYQQANRREKCSRGDFYAGYRAALLELRAWSQFRAGEHVHV